LIILGIHTGFHDASACLFRDFELVAAVSLERLTRRKNDGVDTSRPLPDAAIDEVLEIGGVARSEVDVVAASRALFPRTLFRMSGLAGLKMAFRERGAKDDELRFVDKMMRKQGTLDALDVFRAEDFLSQNGFNRARMHFYNHHLAHGLPAYFFAPFDAAILHTADGAGDGVAYSARRADKSGVTLLYGGDDEGILGPKRAGSLGLMYAGFTKALGYIPNRHEGKLVGLAARGQPVAADRVISYFQIETDGQIRASFGKHNEIADAAAANCRDLKPEDAAASIQEATERLMIESLRRVQAGTGLRKFALAGGVYANVKLNRRIFEELADDLFIYPAMGDDGLVVGGCLDALMQQNGYETWFRRRRRLDDVSWGREHHADAEKLARGRADVALLPDANEDLIRAVVDALVAGRAVGVHEGRMEFGPRALGSRSILASPVRRDINDSLNARLSRSDFMPFAPVVLAEEADAVFDLAPGMKEAARFMTITCNVKTAWREKIPAVVHIDGSARPQILEREPRTLYRRILEAWRGRTGLPVLVNTSFNVHEEPIIDTPAQALDALAADRVDLLVLCGRLFSRR
jgi:carbamoyltransferase